MDRPCTCYPDEHRPRPCAKLYAYSECRKAQIKAMPRIRFVCRRSWVTGPDHYEIGFYWAPDPEAREFEIIYRRWFLVRLRFWLRLDRR